jgi:hypothetical protein
MPITPLGGQQGHFQNPNSHNDQYNKRGLKESMSNFADVEFPYGSCQKATK